MRVGGVTGEENPSSTEEVDHADVGPFNNRSARDCKTNAII
jgi:hypothetical protein